MPKTIKSDSGIYLLELKSAGNFRLNIGKFKNRIFSAGYYYYVGSAQKNLMARVERHKRKNKKIHWHIDHLTTHPGVKIESYAIFPSQEKYRECQLVAELKKEFSIDDAAAGFGNSDCRNCTSHLLFSKKKISHSHFMDLYHSTVLLIPS